MSSHYHTRKTDMKDSYYQLQEWLNTPSITKKYRIRYVPRFEPDEDSNERMCITDGKYFFWINYCDDYNFNGSCYGLNKVDNILEKLGILTNRKWRWFC